ncbi:MAG: ABC transporter substrate-binding protein, partial [Thermotogota bacterium]
MKKILLIVLVAVMIFSTAFSAENSTNGITDDSVKIGSFQALSGALAFIGVSMNKGMEAYFNWINENGGVHGREIDLIAVDDQFVPSKTVIEVKRLVEQDKVFAIVGGLGTPGCLAVMDYLNEGG